jgi:thiol-disulfide isomerase/thioredoxin
MWDRLATDPKPLKGFISKDHGNVGGNVGISKFSVGDTEDVEDEVDESKHDVPIVRTEAGFNALLADGTPAVVEFFQPWCTHCSSFPPTMAKVAKKMAKKAKFARVDVREARTLGRQYQVPPRTQRTHTDTLSHARAHTRPQRRPHARAHNNVARSLAI